MNLNRPPLLLNVYAVWSLTGVLVIFLTMFAFQADAGAASPAQMCGADKVMNAHQIDGYDFATTSWVRAERSANIYRTCVENRAKDRAVWIDWRIPGPRTYVAPLDSAFSERPFWNRKPVNLATCLLYGSYRKPIKEQYLAHEDDAQRAASEGDCSKLAPSATQGLVDSAEPFFAELEGRAAIPSDLDDIDGTLLRFVYKVGLRQTASGYNIALTYETSWVSPEFKGNLNDIIIVPSPKIMDLANTKLADIHLESSSSTIVLPMMISPPYRLSTDSYFFLDRKRRLATEIQVPILLPMQPR